MIWHTKFVICSIPRTGTDIKSHLVRNISEVSRARKARHIKHGSLKVRWREGMIAALTFRQLTPWLLSYIIMGVNDGLYPQHGCRRPFPSDNDLLDPDYGREWLNEDFAKGSIAGLGDRYLNFMTDRGRIPVNRFIRSEYVVGDLIKFLHDLEITFRESDIRQSGSQYCPAKHAYDYIKDPLHYWSSEILARVEELNPNWMKIQRHIYG